MRNIFHFRLLVPSRIIALINHVPGCSPASEQHRLFENSVTLQRQFFHRNQSSWQMSINFSEHSITQLPILWISQIHWTTGNFSNRYFIQSHNHNGILDRPQLNIKSDLIQEFIHPLHFRRGFDQKEFLKGTVHALVIISKALSQGDIDSVEELFTKESFREVKENMIKCSSGELTQLAVNPSDLMTFPYQIDSISR